MHSPKKITREQIAQLPKVVLTISADADTLPDTLSRLAEDNVVYAEITYTGDGTDSALAQVTAAPFEARLITLDSLVDDHVAAHRLSPHLSAVRYVPLTAVADGDVSSIADAVGKGALRLEHPVNLHEDFSVSLKGISTSPLTDWIRDRRIMCSFAPSAEMEDVEEHPVTLLHEMGFTVCVNPGKGSLTDEFWSLVEHFDYGFDEIFTLTCDAMEYSFAPQPVRSDLLHRVIIPGFEAYEVEFNEDAS